MLEADPELEIDALGGRAHASALHVAVYRGKTDIVRLLLERGADPDLANDVNESPMYWARVADDAEIEALLLQYGADVLPTPIYRLGRGV